RRLSFLTRAPQPIADAIAGYEAARNAHQACEALRQLVATAAWTVGILAIACRSRVGAGGRPEPPQARALLGELRRSGLQPAGWIALARALVHPFARAPDTFPIPELVLLFAEETDPVTACLE